VWWGLPLRGRPRLRGGRPRRSACPCSVTMTWVSCSVWSTWETIGTMQEIAPAFACEGTTW